MKTKFCSILLALALILTTVSIPGAMASDADWALSYSFDSLGSYTLSTAKGHNAVTGSTTDVLSGWKVHLDNAASSAALVSATDSNDNKGAKFSAKKSSSNIWAELYKEVSYGEAAFETGDGFYLHTEFSSQNTWLEAAQTNFVINVGGVGNIDIVTCNTGTTGIKIGNDSSTEIVPGSNYGDHSDKLVYVDMHYYPNFETPADSVFEITVSHNGASGTYEKKLSDFTSAELTKIPLIYEVGYRMRITGSGGGSNKDPYAIFINNLAFESAVEASDFEYSEDFENLSSEIYSFSNLTTKSTETVSGTNDARDGWRSHMDATDVKSAVLKKATNDYATGMLFEVEDGDTNFYAKVDKQIESGKYNNAGRLFANGEVFHINTAFSSCWSKDDATQTNLFVNIGGVYDIELVSCYRDSTGIKIGTTQTGITYNESAGHPVYVDVYYTPDFETPADSQFLVMLTHNGNTASAALKLSDIKDTAYTDPMIDAVGYRMRIYGTDNAKRNVLVYNLDYGFAPDFEIPTQAISADKVQTESNTSIAHVYTNDEAKNITLITAAYNAETDAFIKLDSATVSVTGSQIVTAPLDTSDITEEFYIKSFVLDGFKNIKPYIPAKTYGK